MVLVVTGLRRYIRQHVRKRQPKLFCQVGLCVLSRDPLWRLEARERVGIS